MWVLFDFLSGAGGCVFWGVFLSLLGVAGLFVLIQAFKDSKFSMLGYLIGAVLFGMVAVQGVMISGAVKIISTIDYYEGLVQNVVGQYKQTYNSYAETYTDLSSKIDEADSLEIVEQLASQIPMISNIMDEVELHGKTVVQLPGIIAGQLRMELRWYIFRRSLWIAGFMAVGGFLIAKTMEENYSRRGTSRSGGRGDRSVARRSDRAVGGRRRR